MLKWLAIGAGFGIAWGVIAAAVFIAMFRGQIAAPGDVEAAIAVALILLHLPFVVAAGVEAAVGRGSAPFPEIIGVTIAAGADLGLLMSAGIALARRLARVWRNRG